jgi:ribosomal protein S28E/S33
VLFLGYVKMEVKLNEEVKSVMRTKVNRAVKQGDAVYFSDTERIERSISLIRDLKKKHPEDF